MSLLGLIRHMAEVESWFRVFDSEPTEQFLGEDGGIGGGAVPRGDAQGRRTGKRPVQGLAHPV